MKTLLLITSLSLSIAMYWPQFKRILQRKSTGDFSKGFYWMLLGLQVANCFLASMEEAWYLMGLYGFHITAVGLTTVLIYRYYD